MAIIDSLKFFKNFTRYDGDIGIEIETETKKTYIPPEMLFWIHKPDGSLRDFGMEYILKQPVKYGKQLDDALDEFKNKTIGINFVKDSISTSVHVHLNILNETFLTLGNFLTLYTLCENLLIRMSGPDRLSNLFCLPICDAEETYKNIVNMFKGIYAKQWKSLIFQQGTVKYAALNLSSIGNFGSLEIRSFNGDTNIENIKRWVSVLYSILVFSRNEKITPRDIMTKYKDDPEGLIKEVFKEHRDALKFKDEKQLLDKNLFYAASIAYSVKAWRDLDAKENAKFNPSAKDLEIRAKTLFGKKFSELTGGEMDHVYQTLQRDFAAKNGGDPIVPDFGEALAPRPDLAQMARDVINNQVRPRGRPARVVMEEVPAVRNNDWVIAGDHAGGNVGGNF